MCQNTLAPTLVNVHQVTASKKCLSSLLIAIQVTIVERMIFKFETVPMVVFYSIFTDPEYFFPSVPTSSPIADLCFPSFASTSPCPACTALYNGLRRGPAALFLARVNAPSTCLPAPFVAP